MLLNTKTKKGYYSKTDAALEQSLTFYAINKVIKSKDTPWKVIDNNSFDYQNYDLLEKVLIYVSSENRLFNVHADVVKLFDIEYNHFHHNLLRLKDTKTNGKYFKGTNLYFIFKWIKKCHTVYTTYSLDEYVIKLCNSLNDELQHNLKTYINEFVNNNNLTNQDMNNKNMTNKDMTNKDMKQNELDQDELIKYMKIKYLKEVINNINFDNNDIMNERLTNREILLIKTMFTIDDFKSIFNLDF